MRHFDNVVRVKEKMEVEGAKKERNIKYAMHQKNIAVQ